MLDYENDGSLQVEAFIDTLHIIMTHEATNSLGATANAFKSEGRKAPT